MAAGSAFDAKVKAYLYEKTVNDDNPKYSWQALFEAEVEPHLRDWAKSVGDYLFDSYQKCGAIGDLLIDLSKAADAPDFEISVQGAIGGHREGITGNFSVPLLGKPDLRFINEHGAHVIIDFKVNGFMSKASPMAGYVKVRNGWIGEPQCRSSGMHKDCVPGVIDGMLINIATYMENLDESWARQLCTYGWLMGEVVGKELINIIEQGCGFEPQDNGLTLMRWASHRLRISERFQFITLSLYQELWARITETPFWFFRDLTLEQSQAACKNLEKQASLYNDPKTAEMMSWSR
jgi:hypothetical protein